VEHAYDLNEPERARTAPNCTTLTCVESVFRRSAHLPGRAGRRSVVYTTVIVDQPVEQLKTASSASRVAETS